MTVNVLPAATIVPVRALPPVLAATVNATVPLPVPACPAVMVIQPALVDAVHAQVVADAVTAIDPVAAASPTFCEAGEIEKVHAGGGTAAWVTVNVLPATSIVALRAAPVFAATRYATDPFPAPDDPPLIVSQLAVVVAVHAQLDPAVT